MSTVEQLARYSQTAQAAYASGLVSNQSNASAYEDTGSGMSASQAAQFDATWNVLQQSTPLSDGFSAVLLQNRITGEKVLAIAGTDPTSVPDLLTDAINIALLGSIVGMPQYISLLQFYQELRTAELLTASEQFAVTGHSLGGFLAQAFAVNFSDVVTAAYTYNAPGFVGALGQLLDFLGAPGELPAVTITNVRAQEGISVTAGLGITIGATTNVRIEPDPLQFGNHSIARLSDSLAVQAMLERLDPGLTQSAANVLVQSATIDNDASLESLLDEVRRMLLGNSVIATSVGDRDALYANLETVIDALADDGHLHTLAGGLRVGVVSSVLETEARSEFSALLALAMLSTVVLRGNSPANQELLSTTLGAIHADLYDLWVADQELTPEQRASGLANFSDQWLADRAEMLSLVVQGNIADTTNILSIAGSSWIATTYHDTTSGTQITTGGGGGRRIEFGSDANEILNGGAGHDSIYGGGGDDGIWGGAGNDYLEGSDGNDTLYGEDGNDHLVGGAGNDLLTTGPGRDILNGGLGFDVYWISSGATSTTIRDVDGTGSIVIERADFSTYTLGENIRKIPGSPGNYQDDRGNRYRLSGNNLIVSIVDGGRTLVVENFDSMVGTRLGITLQEAEVPALPVTSTIFFGDFRIVDSDPDESGVQPEHDQYGNRINDGTPEVIRDQLFGSADNDLIVGGGLGDILKGRGGDDLIFADTFVDVSQAIVDGAVGLGTPGLLNMSGQNDHHALAGNDGNDIIVGSTGADILNGGSGDDLLIGMQGDDFITGDTDLDVFTFGDYDFNWTFVETETAGGGRLYTYNGPGNWTYATAANSGADVIYAGGGDDVVLGEFGDDLIFGEDGDDRLHGGAGSDTIFGGSGNDFIQGDLDWLASNNPADGGADFIDGGDGDDIILGQTGNDVIFGGAGDDELQGGSTGGEDQYDGDDYLNGEDGNDILLGGAGADVLIGGRGDDFLYGDSPETFAAYQMDDYLDGGEGNDVLVGMGGNDTLLGGAGNDSLYGDSLGTPEAVEGDDYLDGGDGDDYLQGDGGADTLFGGSGHDVLRGGAGADSLIGGEGDDTLYGDDLSTPANLQLDDYLEGGDGNDILLGAGGNDTLIGGAGDDQLQGGDGDDYLETGSGNDVLFGEAGNDTYMISAGAGQVQIVDNEGINNLVFANGVNPSDVQVFFAPDQTTFYVSPTNYVIVYGDAERNIGTMQFSNGTTETTEAVLRSRYQPVTLGSSNSGISLLNGVTAQEVSASRWNGDLLLSYSGSQADWVDLASLQALGIGARIEDGDKYGLPAGTQTLVLMRWYEANPSTYVNYLIDSNNATTNLVGLAGIAPITRAGGEGNDFIEGTQQHETILGYAGHDYLVGGDGNDVIVGDAGDDALFGGGGDDTLQGGEGDDYIDPGTGSDALMGGAGNDTYVVGPGTGRAQIIDTDGANRLVMQAIADSDANVWFENGSISVGASWADRVVMDVATFNALDSVRFGNGRYNTYTNDGQGTITAQRFDADDALLGTSTTVTDSQGNVLTTIFDVASTVIGNAWKNVDGTYGDTTFNADGSSAGVTHRPDGSYVEFTDDGQGNTVHTTYTFQGVRTRETWQSADGSYGSTAFNANGSSNGIAHNADGGYSTHADDGRGNINTINYNAQGMRTSETWTLATGSYSTTTDDGAGNTTTTIFNADGVRLIESWRRADGSHGSDTFFGDGSSAGVVYYPDGASSTYENNGRGGISTRNFLWDGTPSGHVVTQTHGFNNQITSYFDASGNQHRQTWIHADGSSGENIVSNASFNATINFAHIGLAYGSGFAAEEYQEWVMPNGSMGGYDPSVYSWNPPIVANYFDWYLDVATGLTELDPGSDGEFRYSAFGGIYSDGGSETWLDFNWSDGRLQLNAFVPGSSSSGFYNYIQFTDYQANTFFYTEQLEDGTKLFQAVGLGGLVVEQVFPTIGTPINVTIEGDNGFSATFTDDGAGNFTQQIFSPDGALVREVWMHNDGAYGLDRFGTDGSRVGLNGYADGTIFVYESDNQGQLIPTWYPGAAASVVMINDPPRSISVPVAPSPSSYRTAPTGTAYSSAGATSTVSDGNGGDVTITWDINGRATVWGSTTTQVDGHIDTNPGYGSQTNLAGVRYGWTYDETGLPTASLIDDNAGTVTSRLYDDQGRLTGTAVATTDVQGVVTTQRYNIFGDLTGTLVRSVNAQSEIVTNEYDANGSLLGYSIQVVGEPGNSITTRYDAVGNLTGITTITGTGVNHSTIAYYDGNAESIKTVVTTLTTEGVVLTNTYDGNGNITDSVVLNRNYADDLVTAFYDESDNLSYYVVRTIHPQGAVEFITYDPRGVRLRESMLEASGTHIGRTYEQDGSSVITTRRIDGSYTLVTNDGYGTIVTTEYNAQDVRLSDSWIRPDGSTGTDTFNGDGSSTGTILYSDGRYATVSNDGQGQVAVHRFASDGTPIGSTITLTSTTARVTTTYDASGNLIGTVWTSTGGSSGTSPMENHAPVTVDDVATVFEDGVQVATGNVLSNDSDSDSGTVLQVAQPGSQSGQYGELTIGADGGYTYVLNNDAAVVQSLRHGQEVQDSFGYFATDGSLQTEGVLTVTVIGANDTPIAQDDALTVSEDGVLSSRGNALSNDSDVDVGTVLTVGNPGTMTGTYGQLTLSADGHQTYMLDNDALNVQQLGAGETVTDEFHYIVHDDDTQSLSATARIVVSVAGANDAPVLSTPLGDVVGQEGESLSFSLPSGAFTDVDRNDALAYTATLADGTPLPDWIQFDASNQSFAVNAQAGDAGTYDLRVTATDLFGASASGDFNLRVDQATSGQTFNFVVDGQWPWLSFSASFADISGKTRTDSVYLGTSETTNLLVGTSEGDAILLDDYRLFGLQQPGSPRLVGIAVIDAGAGDDVVDLFSYRFAYGPVTVYGGAGNDRLIGGAGANVLFGDDGNDTLVGQGGNDLLDGGAGDDVMYGGAGDDIYIVDSENDVLVEYAGNGMDTVRASVSHALGFNFENLILIGSGDINGYGNTQANVIVGNDGNNILNGGFGADTMIGGLGDDTYVVDNAGDTVVENANEGIDSIQSSVSYTLGANVENLTLTGLSSINATGNDLDNILIGNIANNTLIGGGGNDTLDGGSWGTDSLRGGTGDDTYVVNRTFGVTIAENANEGIDTVQSSVSHSLTANIEMLFLTGTAAINGTGNTLANWLRGNSANNVLSGGGGTDWLDGGDGNDTLSSSSGNSLFSGGAGTDSMTGSSANELFIGGVGNDSISTGSGADIIAFNLGDGQDTVAASTTRDNTISIGGGATYADLAFSRVGNDLVLRVGANDRITLTGYYSSSSNRSVSTLQVVIEGTSDYDPSSSDVTRDQRIERFNFEGLVAAFDAARAANPSIITWALTNALAANYVDGSDTQAIGGELAYRYGRSGSLADISYADAMSILGSGQFGTTTQSLQSLGEPKALLSLMSNHLYGESMDPQMLGEAAGSGPLRRRGGLAVDIESGVSIRTLNDSMMRGFLTVTRDGWTGDSLRRALHRVDIGGESLLSAHLFDPGAGPVGGMITERRALHPTGGQRTEFAL